MLTHIRIAKSQFFLFSSLLLRHNDDKTSFQLFWMETQFRLDATTYHDLIYIWWQCCRQCLSSPRFCTSPSNCPNAINQIKITWPNLCVRCCHRCSHISSNDEMTITFNIELANEMCRGERVCQNDFIVFSNNLCRHAKTIIAENTKKNQKINSHCSAFPSMRDNSAKTCCGCGKTLWCFRDARVDTKHTKV